ncbi:MAG: N-acetylneuraminate synthase family protein [Candidatus Scalindua sp.]
MSKVFIIAEAGVNHNGSLEICKKLIDVSVQAGADAVKFQTFRAERLVTATASKVDYQIGNMGTDELQFEMLEKIEKLL